jgi:hypothetical protein
LIRLTWTNKAKKKPKLGRVLTLFGSSERTKDIVKYVDNLGREFTLCKQKLMKMSRSSLRLRGWLKYRIKRSSKPWIHVRLDSFCQLTGLSLRTAKRSLNSLRDENNDLVIRTIHQDRRWKIVCSTTGRLHGLKRSEPFNMSEDGRTQVVKERKQGKKIVQEQLIVGKDKAYWNAKSNDSLATEQEGGGSEYRTENPCDPNQLNLDLKEPTISHVQSNNNTSSRPISVSDKISFAHTIGKNFVFKDKRQIHEQARIFAKKQRGLAWSLAREMKTIHYDNMKVRHEMRHSFVFALESIQRSVKRNTIIKAYEIAAHEVHAIAVDQGVTTPGSWSPSSTISKARQLLEKNECYGNWKPNPSKEVGLIHWSGSK